MGLTGIQGRPLLNHAYDATYPGYRAGGRELRWPPFTISIETACCPGNRSEEQQQHDLYKDDALKVSMRITS